MRNRIFAVTAAVMLSVAATTSGALALEQVVGIAKHGGHWARVVWRGDRYYAWGANGRGLPFGPPLGALYSYGSRHACNPYDPFTALYGYCGGPYHYDGW
jgi:hypothetical protein